MNIKEIEFGVREGVPACTAGGVRVVVFCTNFVAAGVRVEDSSSDGAGKWREMLR